MQHLSTLRSGAMERGLLPTGKFSPLPPVPFKPCQLRSLCCPVSMPITSTGESPCRSVEFYDKLQNTVGGGKPKMRWFFGERHLSTHIKMAMHE